MTQIIYHKPLKLYFGGTIKSCKMSEVTKNTHKKIYWLLIIAALLIGFLIYGILKDQFGLRFLIFFSGVPFFLFVMGIFGLLWPKIKPEGNEVYIIHTMWIGVIFIVLFFIHVWVILPLVCPSFAECLKM